VIVAARFDKEMSASSPNMSPSFKILTLLNIYYSFFSLVIILYLELDYYPFYPNTDIKPELSFFASVLFSLQQSFYFCRVNDVRKDYTVSLFFGDKVVFFLLKGDSFVSFFFFSANYNFAFKSFSPNFSPIYSNMSTCLCYSVIYSPALGIHTPALPPILI